MLSAARDNQERMDAAANSRAPEKKKGIFSKKEQTPRSGARPGPGAPGGGPRKVPPPKPVTSKSSKNEIRIAELEEQISAYTTMVSKIMIERDSLVTMNRQLMTQLPTVMKQLKESETRYEELSNQLSSSKSRHDSDSSKSRHDSDSAADLAAAALAEESRSFSNLDLSKLRGVDKPQRSATSPRIQLGRTTVGANAQSSVGRQASVPAGMGQQRSLGRGNIVQK